jgi:serine/threonine protein phosphatase PrpC
MSSTNHYLVLATDGVWDALSNEDVVTIINTSIVDHEFHHVGYRLISTSRQRGSGDNITICIVFA